MIELGQFRPTGPTSVALGFFDGVHRGHQALLSRAEVAFTFCNHPETVLRPDCAPALLTTFAERGQIIESMGRTVVYREFDRDFASMAPESFAREVLRGQLQAERLVMGPNYRFGHRAAGTPELLRELGFEITLVDPVELWGRVISSTGIRQLLTRGRASEAASCMGRPYSWRQTVARGQRRGRELGTPTANLPLPEGKVVPAMGVYVMQAELEGTVYNAVANLGLRPTFGQATAPVLEVHLLHFEGDLYDRELTVRFLGRLREERRFDGLDSLREQIARDREQALQFFGV
ncbi:riboflavin biosynthesis protein RibF [bacterium CPR1]|nr:riboflavin biosynthesis protein RibF [bacterium CPR1]